MYKKKCVSRESSEFVFRLPCSFLASDYLKGRLAKRTDCLNYLVSTILRRQAMGAGHGNDDFVMLNAAQLNTIMAKDDASAVIEAAVSGGAIDIDNHYVKGSHSRGYRLNERFKNDKIIKVKPTDRRMISALERPRNKHQVHHKDPQTSNFIQQMMDEYHKLDIDLGLAREVIKNLPEESNPFDRQTVIIEDLADKNFVVYPTRWRRNVQQHIRTPLTSQTGTQLQRSPTPLHRRQELPTRTTRPPSPTEPHDRQPLTPGEERADHLPQPLPPQHHPDQREAPTHLCTSPPEHPLTRQDLSL
jgi:hypothetical protein